MARGDEVADRRRMLRRERALWRSGISLVAGVDEVGMGPLAGPVVAAAVVLPRNVKVNGVRDSKLMTARQRERVELELRASALCVGIGVVSPEEIDRLNIYQAGIRAMELAVLDLASRPGHLLIDARRIPTIEIGQTRVVDGDRDVYSIAAASIVAKVYRDRLMRELDATYPGYGFAKHAGYATRAHFEALRALGPSPIHRRSFAPVRALLQVEEVKGS
jgi:ribonuclease HII